MLNSHMFCLSGAPSITTLDKKTKHKSNNRKNEKNNGNENFTYENRAVCEFTKKLFWLRLVIIGEFLLQLWFCFVSLSFNKFRREKKIEKI